MISDLYQRTKPQLSERLELVESHFSKPSLQVPSGIVYKLTVLVYEVELPVRLLEAL